MKNEMIISDEELNLIMQWFNAVQDLNYQYLVKSDYQLAIRIHEKLGMRVPHDVIWGSIDAE